MLRSRISQLKDARRQQTLLRITRRYEKFPIRGYVTDIGPKFFALQLVSDRIWFDGFECFRIADVKEIKVDPYARFAEAALKKRGESKSKKSGVNVRDIRSILQSANRVFPLITLHREAVDSTVCQIGRVAEIKRDKVSLLEIRPNATWRSQPDEYRLSEITRVSVGGDYEDALHIVGGNPVQNGRPG